MWFQVYKLNFNSFKYQNIFISIGVIKKIFSSLPEPLIPFKFYDIFIKATDVITDEKELLLKLKKHISEFPEINRKVFAYMIYFLNDVS